MFRFNIYAFYNFIIFLSLGLTSCIYGMNPTDLQDLTQADIGSVRNIMAHQLADLLPLNAATITCDTASSNPKKRKRKERDDKLRKERQKRQAKRKRILHNSRAQRIGGSDFSRHALVQAIIYASFSPEAYVSQALDILRTNRDSISEELLIYSFRLALSRGLQEIVLKIYNPDNLEESLLSAEGFRLLFLQAISEKNMELVAMLSPIVRQATLFEEGLIKAAEMGIISLVEYLLAQKSCSIEVCLSLINLLMIKVNAIFDGGEENSRNNITPYQCAIESDSRLEVKSKKEIYLEIIGLIHSYIDQKNS